MKTPFFKYAALAIVLLISACKEDINNASWDADLLAPISTVSFSIDDLLADSILQSDADHAVRVVYENNLTELPWDSVLEIPDTTVINELISPVGFDLSPGASLASINQETRYDLKGASLTKAIVREGRTRIEIVNTLETKVFFTYTLPTATLNGIPFEFSGVVDAAPAGGEAVYAEDFDMSGYHLDLTGSNGTSQNTLVTQFGGTSDPNGPTVHINANDPFIIVRNSFLDIVPDYVRGYFGTQSINMETDTNKFDMFSSIIAGQLELDSVTIGLSVTNSIGADARVRFSDVASVNTRTGNTVNLNHEVIGNPINITRATEIGAQSYNIEPSFTNVELNNGNSNIVEFLENLPDELVFSMDFMLNPLGNISGGNDFFYYQSDIETSLNIEIPLKLRADNLTLSDTVEFDGAESGFSNNLNSGEFRVIADNGFPFEARLQMRLMDGAGNLLDTLFAPNVILPPALDADNKVISSQGSILVIPISESKAQSIQSTKNINLLVSFDTNAGNQLVKIYDHYRLDLKLIGDFNYTVHQP